jgi:hypothetical protein
VVAAPVPVAAVAVVSAAARRPCQLMVHWCDGALVAGGGWMGMSRADEPTPPVAVQSTRRHYERSCQFTSSPTTTTTR